MTKPSSYAVAILGVVVLVAVITPAYAKPQQLGKPESRRKPIPPQPPSVEGAWEIINTNLMTRLETEDLGALAVSLDHAQPSRDPKELLLRLNVFVRAGDSKQAEAAIYSLRRTDISRKVVNVIPGFLIENGEYALAKLMLEKFPKSQATCTREFIAYLRSSIPPVDPDRWLVARSRSNPNFWIWQRLEVAKNAGTRAKIFDELALDLRRHPTDIQRANLYTNVISLDNAAADIGWLPDVCKFPISIQYQELAERIRSAYPKVALRLLEKSLQMPITPDDFKWLHTAGKGMLGAAAFPNEKSLRAEQRYHLMEIYKQTGQPDKALKVLEQLTADNPAGLPTDYGEFAGQSQLAAGTRVFENRIVAAETDNKESEAYWLTRGDYYNGRKEDDKATDAFMKALDIGSNAGYDSDGHCNAATTYSYYLFTAHGYTIAKKWVQSQLDKSPANGSFAASMAKQLMVLEDEYFRSMLVAHHNADAEKWVRGRLAETPATGAETDRLIEMLLYFSENGLGEINPADEMLWRYVEANKEWGGTETSVLRQFLRSPDEKVRAAVLERVEKLASDGEPSRGRLVGSFLSVVGNGDRAIPWLTQALKNYPVNNYPGGDLTRHHVASELYSIYLKRNNWRAATALLPELAPKYNDYNWTVNNYSDLAMSAARGGDTEQAMFLFKKVVNYNRSLHSKAGFLVRMLGSLGMKEPIRAFYRVMAEQDPNSVIPQKALALLDQPLTPTRGRGGQMSAAD